MTFDYIWATETTELTDEQMELIRISLQVGAATGTDFRNALDIITNVQIAYSEDKDSAIEKDIALKEFIEENFKPSDDAILNAKELGIEIESQATS